MISLNLDKPHPFKVGDVMHLRVKAITMMSPGRWVVDFQDITPLPGAEPDGYGCHFCGGIEAAREDGSLPDGWDRITFEKGAGFVCPGCSGQKFCRVCGCTEAFPCEIDGQPCHWVDDNLCSACAEVA